MPTAQRRLGPDDLVTKHMHQDFTTLRQRQTVGEALDGLRQHPPHGQIIYFYVLDDQTRLCGVVPTRRLVLSQRDASLADIMIPNVVTLPADATVLDACEFFIQHRLLAFPVVDEQGRLLGVVDIDLYTNALSQLESATPVARLVEPLARFFRIESSGGVVLLVCTVAALILANSPLAAAFANFWQTQLGVTAGAFTLIKSVLLWINDGLMVLFFFVVGLEIKREIVLGELADPRKALLPIVAAAGGMLLPALIYLLCLWHRPGWRGWGVPTATDIAFVVGFLTLLGPRVPNGLKVLILTLAIADDIGAVIIIAIVYSTQPALVALFLAVGGLAVVALLYRLRVHSIPVHIFLGLAIWLAFLKSGVHPTVAGVFLGLLTPARPGTRRRVVLDVAGDLIARLRSGRGEPAQQLAAEAVSPAERLEDALHPWVAFVILPLFALANAGVKVEAAALTTPIALAVAAGLVFGKPLGILLFSWASVRMGITRLPEGVGWKAMIGAGCLGGIGFTMSLFIAGLAMTDDMLMDAKIGTLTGSAVSATVGTMLLWAFLPRFDFRRRTT